MRTYWYAGLALLAGIVLFACQSGDTVVGQSVINPQQLAVQSFDSVTVRTATVMRPDSFVTSGDVNILAGTWKDPQTGLLTARSFVAVNYATNALYTQTNIRLDSMVLELNYAFVYGDTTSLFDLSVHPLNLTLPNKLYYNTNSVAYTSKPFLQKKVYPQPRSRGRQIRFRLSDTLAQTFFAKLRNSEISDFTTLSEFFPGFALINNSSANTIAGFTAATSGLRLYYHTTDIDQTASTLLFPFSATYFTQIRNDLTGTPLSALKNRPDQVSSRLTDNTSFVVPGANLLTRIEFPYLAQFDVPERFADVNKALLVVSPIRRNLNDNTPPPAQLELFFTNIQNDILATPLPGGVTGSTQSIAQYPNILNSTLLTNVNVYTFDLTYYIGQIIKRKTLNQPLLLSLPIANTTTLQQRIQRVTLGNQQRPNDKLQVQLFITSGT